MSKVTAVPKSTRSKDNRKALPPGQHLPIGLLRSDAGVYNRFHPQDLIANLTKALLCFPQPRGRRDFFLAQPNKQPPSRSSGALRIDEDKRSSICPSPFVSAEQFAFSKRTPVS